MSEFRHSTKVPVLAQTQPVEEYSQPGVERRGEAAEDLPLSQPSAVQSGRPPWLTWSL